MTRRHFQTLAAALRSARTCWAEHDDGDYTDALGYTVGCPEQRAWENAVNAVADVCATANPLFDRDRFLAAAGMGITR